MDSDSLDDEDLLTNDPTSLASYPRKRTRRSPPSRSRLPAHDSKDADPLSAPFFFRPRRDQLKWRLLSHLDPDQIVSETDIETLEQITRNLTFARIRPRDLKYHSEETFVTLFRLAQLIVEYLLHVQDVLSAKRTSLERDSDALLRKYERAREVLSRRRDQVHELRRENRKLKRTVFAYQLVFGASPEKAKLLLQGMKFEKGQQPGSIGGDSSLSHFGSSEPSPVSGDSQSELRQLRDEVRQLREEMSQETRRAGEVQLARIEEESQKIVRALGEKQRVLEEQTQMVFSTMRELQSRMGRLSSSSISDVGAGVAGGGSGGSASEIVRRVESTMKEYMVSSSMVEALAKKVSEIIPRPPPAAPAPVPFQQQQAQHPSFVSAGTATAGRPLSEQIDVLQRQRVGLDQLDRLVATQGKMGQKTLDRLRSSMDELDRSAAVAPAPGQDRHHQQMATGLGDVPAPGRGGGFVESSWDREVVPAPAPAPTAASAVAVAPVPSSVAVAVQENVSHQQPAVSSSEAAPREGTADTYSDEPPESSEGDDDDLTMMTESDPLFPHFEPQVDKLIQGKCNPRSERYVPDETRPFGSTVFPHPQELLPEIRRLTEEEVMDYAQSRHGVDWEASGLAEGKFLDAMNRLDRVQQGEDRRYGAALRKIGDAAEVLWRQFLESPESAMQEEQDEVHRRGGPGPGGVAERGSRPARNAPSSAVGQLRASVRLAKTVDQFKKRLRGKAQPGQEKRRPRDGGGRGTGGGMAPHPPSGPEAEAVVAAAPPPRRSDRSAAAGGDPQVRRFDDEDDPPPRARAEVAPPEAVPVRRSPQPTTASRPRDRRPRQPPSDPAPAPAPAPAPRPTREVRRDVSRPTRHSPVARRMPEVPVDVDVDGGDDDDIPLPRRHHRRGDDLTPPRDFSEGEELGEIPEDPARVPAPAHAPAPALAPVRLLSDATSSVVSDPSVAVATAAVMDELSRRVGTRNGPSDPPLIDDEEPPRRAAASASPPPAVIDESPTLPPEDDLSDLSPALMPDPEDMMATEELDPPPRTESVSEDDQINEMHRFIADYMKGDDDDIDVDASDPTAAEGDLDPDDELLDLMNGNPLGDSLLGSFNGGDGTGGLDLGGGFDEDSFSIDQEDLFGGI